MEEVIYRGRKFTLVKRARSVGGRTVWGEYLVHPGAVAVLAVAEGEVLLVRQFRGALGQWTLEVPAGTLEPGEDPAEAATREMVEGAGFKPPRLEAVVDSPGSEQKAEDWESGGNHDDLPGCDKLARAEAVS